MTTQLAVLVNQLIVWDQVYSISAAAQYRYWSTSLGGAEVIKEVRCGWDGFTILRDSSVPKSPEIQLRRPERLLFPLSRMHYFVTFSGEDGLDLLTPN